MWRDHNSIVNLPPPIGQTVNPKWTVFGQDAAQGTLAIFSRDEKTLYEALSIHPSVRGSVTLSLFGLLGATNAVYTALFHFSPFQAIHAFDTDFWFLRLSCES